MFHVVENEIYQDADYLVCDDLGNEWADHIAIKDDTISFIHSKCKDKAGLSASAFQEIVGQATKNIGNLDPSDKELDNKKNLGMVNHGGRQVFRSCEKERQKHLSMLSKNCE